MRTIYGAGSGGTENQAAIDDPVLGFSFAIEIEGTLQGFFTECSSVTITRETEPIEEGGINDFVHQLPKRAKISPITFKRGVADVSLWTWFQTGLLDGKITRKHVSVVLYNGKRDKARRWNLFSAYPTRWSGPDLRTEANQVAVETLEIVCTGVEMTDWQAV
jgi:phage tail-like protein